MRAAGPSGHERTTTWSRHVPVAASLPRRVCVSVVAANQPIRVEGQTRRPASKSVTMQPMYSRATSVSSDESSSLVLRWKVVKELRWLARLEHSNRVDLSRDPDAGFILEAQESGNDLASSRGFEGEQLPRLAAENLARRGTGESFDSHRHQYRSITETGHPPDDGNQG